MKASGRLGLAVMALPLSYCAPVLSVPANPVAAPRRDPIADCVASARSLARERMAPVEAYCDQAPGSTLHIRVDELGNVVRARVVPPPVPQP